MITLTNLSKHYNDLVVLKDINLSIHSGQSVAITGPSGSGKSTLLNLIAGIDTATKGSITVKSTELTSLSEPLLAQFRREHIGFVFQFHHLLADFNLLENVAMPLLITGVSKSVAYKEAKTLLERINLDHRSHHFISELSGGERQRGAILRAVISKPQLIIADEPTGNLDEANSAIALELLLSLAKEVGSTIIMATHNQGIADKLDIHYSLHSGVLCQA